MLGKIWNFIEHHRFTVVGPIVGLIIWVAAVGCMAEVESPLTGKMVGANELQLDFDYMVMAFEVAGQQLKEKQEAIDGLKAFLITLASGNITDFSNLLTAILGGGFLGLLGDNIRKNGVIGGLKQKSL
jgi:hypothetical protein